MLRATDVFASIGSGVDVLHFTGKKLDGRGVLVEENEEEKGAPFDWVHP